MNLGKEETDTFRKYSKKIIQLWQLMVQYEVSTNHLAMAISITLTF